jgi:hypothetical protein
MVTVDDETRIGSRQNLAVRSQPNDDLGRHLHGQHEADDQRRSHRERRGDHELPGI